MSSEQFIFPGTIHEIFSKWVDVIGIAQHSAHIVVDERNPEDWIYRLAPLLIDAIDRGVNIHVLGFFEGEFVLNFGAPSVRQSFFYLAAIGCHVYIEERARHKPQCGLLADYGDGNNELILHFEPSMTKEIAYIVQSYELFIELWVEQFKTYRLLARPSNPHKFEFRRAELKRATQYLCGSNSVYKGRNFALREAKFCDVLAQEHPLRAWKAKQIRFLINLYLRNGLSAFEPIEFDLTNGQTEIFQGIVLEPFDDVLPPELQINIEGNGLFIAEGHTRLRHLWEMNERDTFLALILLGNPIPRRSKLTDLTQLPMSNIPPPVHNPLARKVELHSRDRSKWNVVFERPTIR